MSLYEAASASPETFELAARALGKDWLAAMREGMPAGRRGVLDQWIRGSRSLPQITAWLVAEGLDARLVLMQLITDRIGDVGRFGTYPTSSLALFRLVAANGPHIELPWLWLELLAEIPGEKKQIAQDFDREGRGFDPRQLASVLDHALRHWEPFSHRAMAARRLRSLGVLQPDLAMRWLGDQALRKIGEEFLGIGVHDHETDLRALLAESAGGEREAIVRLLRKVDERIALDGSTEATDDATLQTRLRADPRDATTSMVWCDLLGMRGDPRGELISLEHAIAGADPDRALELSRAQAEICAAHRKGIWNRPGGWPFREKYRGRDFVGFQSDWGHKIRGTASTILQRAQKLAKHVTSVHGPVEVHLGRSLTDAVEPAAVEPAGALEHELQRVLGEAALYQSGELRFARREHPELPLADEAGFVDLCVQHPQVTLVYRFLLVWPGTRIPLPHQEGEHYSGGVPLQSRLAIYLDENWLSLDLKFPFEEFSHGGFVASYDAICATLGRVLTPSRFVTYASSADCKRMVKRLTRFAR
ncbi:MAG: hypothetical protein ABI867_07445 [Kofleriaceae bacterium]